MFARVDTRRFELLKADCKTAMIPFHHAPRVQQTGFEPARHSASVPKTDVYTVPPLLREWRQRDLNSPSLPTPDLQSGAPTHMRLVAIGRESESRTPALRSQSASASVTPIPEIFLWTICFVLVCRPQNMQGFYFGDLSSHQRASAVAIYTITKGLSVWSLEPFRHAQFDGCFN